MIKRRRHPPFWGLLGLALIALGHAWAYGPWFTDLNLPAGLRILTLYPPMWLFAFGWLVSGVAILVSAIRGRPGWVAVGGIVFMTMLWGLFYLLGFSIRPTRGDILWGTGYIGLGLYIWGNVPPDDAKQYGRRKGDF